MTRALNLIFVSADTGLLQHWQHALDRRVATVVSQFSEIPQSTSSAMTMLWVDLSLHDLPAWTHPRWTPLLTNPKVKVVAASSNPNDEQAIPALDAGCSAYCHAFADAVTLLQVKEVVQSGHVWVGPTLMQRLIRSANLVSNVKTASNADWGEGLTQREREVAIFAANGASNLDIARNCRISERTVKAHLSAVFEKLNLTDRLQLALRVHGIH
jgi:DNA-binding NarL/FixJ family response regulator